MKIKKKIGGGGEGGRGQVEGGGRGGCDRRIEVFGKIQKKKIWGWGGGGWGVGGGVGGGGGGQGGCE